MTINLGSTIETGWAAPAHATAEAPRLDELAVIPREQLAAMFAEAAPPESVSGLEGDPVCRGIIRGGHLARRWAASASCTWIGKSFAPIGPRELLGHNRLRLFGARRMLSFTATVAPSLHDGRPALILRYDDPRSASPRWTHPIHDELREVAPGLLAGPAGIQLRGRAYTLCWFAIDTTADRTTSQTTRRRVA